jgi:hypothetical protein
MQLKSNVFVCILCQIATRNRNFGEFQCNFYVRQVNSLMSKLKTVIVIGQKKTA